MSGREPIAFGEAAELRGLLQQLGSEAPAPRDVAQERAREDRVAANLDAELAGLVKGRRTRRRASYGVLAAAAAVALTLGARQLHWGLGGLAIFPEPVPAGTPTPLEVTSEATAVKPATAPAAPAQPSRSRGVPAVASTVASTSAAPSAGPESTLAEENRLFKEAAEVGRNGDVRGAVARLDKLLRDHPSSPLAQTAVVRKFRLLAKAGHWDEARLEAERYLQAYPTGFAVKEAQTLQAGGGGPGAP